jgi:hypothetical protein
MPDDHYLAFKLMMSKIPKGKIEDQAVSSKVEEALIKIWPLLDGASEEGMYAAKLRGRMESIEWTPPILTFVIERHGAVVMGSIYGALHHWEVNVEDLTASLNQRRKRLVGKRQPTLKVQPLVQEIVELIKNCQEDERLKWAHGNHRVQIQIGKIIPDNVVAQTLQGRRRRFSKLLEETLAEMRWQKLPSPHHTYEKGVDG